jgi:hypothetical protein
MKTTAPVFFVQLPIDEGIIQAPGCVKMMTKMFGGMLKWVRG